MFQLVKNPVFKHLVKVRVPVDNGFQERSFKAQFRAMDDDELAGYRIDTVEAIKAYIRAFFIGFEDVFDDQTPPQPIPYSDETREGLIGMPYVRRALMDTYTAALMGEKRGN